MIKTFKRQEIPEVILINPKTYFDNRGYFFEAYTKKDLFSMGINEDFNQDNFSFSRKNVLRGLHYQDCPFEQSKLVRVISGEIFDVVVDIRKNSPTYGKHISLILSQKNKNSLYIPKGFAHGFFVLSNEAKVYYKTSGEFSPKNEKGIIWNDTYLNINWPIDNPIISEKDKKWPEFNKI